MRTYVTFTGIVLAGWTLASCAGPSPEAPRAAPVSGFDFFPDSVRGFSDFGAVDGVVERIEVPRNTKRVVLHFDCSANKGSVSVHSKSGPLVEGTCGSIRGEGKGVIANDFSPQSGPLSIHVDVPAGGKWSAAVDLVR